MLELKTALKKKTMKYLNNIHTN